MKNRIGKTGGGVAVYVADHIGALRLNELESPDLELLWVKLKAGSNVLLLGICYRPPNSKADFWTKLQDSVDRAKQNGYQNILIAGDLNAHPPTREGRNLNYFCNSNNLTALVKDPTRITQKLFNNIRSISE